MPTCCIIGETDLAIRCGEKLKQSGYAIRALVSAYPPARKWATQHNVPYYTSIKLFLNELEKIQFDYLFSIVNPYILKEALLSKPKHLAINFHDALLPKYAGVNATSWSILNNEPHQGITWHVMSQEIDTGDILKQAHFEINPNETASTLIKKGYDAAIIALTELLDDLAQNKYKCHPQNLSNRTYHSLNDLFPNHGIISFDMDAKKIYRLWRSLQKENFINKLTLPKVFIRDEFFILKQCCITSHASKKPPGTINEITDEYISIATNTMDIIIQELSTLDGDQVDFIDLTKNKHYDINKYLPTFNFETNTICKKVLIASKAKEGYWINQLMKYQQSNARFNDILPSLLFNKLEPFSKYRHKINEASLLAILIDGLYRLNNNSPFIIWFENNILAQRSSDSMGLISHQIPLLIDLKPEQTFSETLRFTERIIHSVNNITAYERDIFIRYQLETFLDEHKQIMINFNYSRKPSEVIYKDYDLVLNALFRDKEALLMINNTSFGFQSTQ